VNFESLSDTITLGMPKWHTQLSNNSWAIFGASSVVLYGINLTYLLNLSTIVNMPSKPFDTGKCVIKSMLMDSKQEFGTGNGCSNPAGFCVEDLFY
jgi:membrane-bound metal-dependent hydrolase YbcI (DUF457 family)